MNDNFIKIRGAKVNNLKNVSVDIPKNKLVVITGLSGSGKSSLAFDTLYAEGQRRYVESLSAYARQFLGVMDKPDVEKIEGISPAISIDQRKGIHNPRSTVGTITEIYDYLRLLFARIGKPICSKCGKIMNRTTTDQISKKLLTLSKNSEIIILGPIATAKEEYHKTLEEIKKRGFVRVRINGIIYQTEEALKLNLDEIEKHNIEIVIDSFLLKGKQEKSRLVDSVKTALRIGGGVMIANYKSKRGNNRKNDLIFSERFTCEKCGTSLPELEPRIFSFNNPLGACPRCKGLGEKLEIDPELIIPNKNLTIAEGAIWPWMRHSNSHKIGKQNHLWKKLSETAEKHRFSLDEPVKDLSKESMDIILFGDPSTSAEAEGWKGVIADLEKKYYETDSDWTRQEIGQYMVQRQCPQCLGKRLKPEILVITVAGKSIDQVVEMPVEKTKIFFEELTNSKRLTSNELKVAEPIIKETLNRLQFLTDVGLDYLTLDRKALTLAGGEEQRIRIATQIGSKLSGVLYILDEPSIGLHSRDQYKLIETLKRLRDLGNTVIVVEHDPQTILAADWVIDIGPGAGKNGGKVIFKGTPKELLKSHTLTGEYLAGRKKVKVDKNSKCKNQNAKLQSKIQNLTIVGASEHNLKNIDVKIPLGKFVCVTGVSGSGKSSLVNDILAKYLLKKFYRAKEEPGKFKEILGTEYLNKVALVDQSPIGRTPRSNPATYTGVFSYIRDVFTNTKEAKSKGYGPNHFSFNVEGGRCETCEGQGQIKVEMYFLPDVYAECQECGGQRYSKEVLAIEYKGKNIAEILSMTVEEAIEFFKNVPPLFAKLKTLRDVGLSYVELGQPATSLSGGEAQRIKLAAELSHKSSGKTLYVLDEPTTGLHPDDIKKLLFVLKELVAKGNTVLAVEHNLDFIKNSDWIIDLGPEGGDKGGEIVITGTLQEIRKCKKSYTGKYL